MIPAAIQALLPQHPGEENRIGLSGAQVVMYEDCVLKVQPDTGNAANEGIMLRFLKGRLPVPEVLAEADLCIQDVLNGTARENHSAYPTVVRNHNGTPFLPDQLLERYLTGNPLKNVVNRSEGY